MRRKKKWTKQQLADIHLRSAIRGAIGMIRFDALKDRKVTKPEAVELLARSIDDLNDISTTDSWEGNLDEMREEEESVWVGKSYPKIRRRNVKARR